MNLRELLEVHIVREAVSSVGKGADFFPRLQLREIKDLIVAGPDSVETVSLDKFVEFFLSNRTGRDLGLKIVALHLRHADVVKKEVKKVLSEFSPFQELDGGELQPFLVAVLDPRRPAGVDPANIHVVDGAAQPCD